VDAKTKPKKQYKSSKHKRSKAKGAKFEARVRNFYRKYGWYVQRNTWGLYDLVCVPPDKIPIDTPPELISTKVRMLQLQTRKYIAPTKRNALIKNQKWNNASDCYFVTRENKAPWGLIHIFVSNLPERRLKKTPDLTLEYDAYQ